MSKGTVPAWQAREMKRQKLLERIQQKIIGWEERFEHNFPYYGVWCQIFHLTLAGRHIFSTSGLGHFTGRVEPAFMCERPMEKRAPEARMVEELLLEVMADIGKCKRTTLEGTALLAALLEWTTGQYTAPFHAALRDEEFANPQLLYGTDHATDEVPIPGR